MTTLAVLGLGWAYNLGMVRCFTVPLAKTKSDGEDMLTFVLVVCLIPYLPGVLILCEQLLELPGGLARWLLSDPPPPPAAGGSGN